MEIKILIMTKGDESGGIQNGHFEAVLTILPEPDWDSMDIADKATFEDEMTSAIKSKLQELSWAFDDCKVLIESEKEFHAGEKDESEYDKYVNDLHREG